MTEQTAQLEVKFTGDSSSVEESARRGSRSIKDFGDDTDAAGRKGSKFGKSVGKSTAALKKMRTGLNAAGKAAGAFGAAVGLASGAALAKMVKEGLASADALAKTADAAGITTTSLAGLQRAFDVTGVGAEKVGQAMGKTSKFVLDAQRGLSTATDTLAVLNINVEDLIDLKPDEAFAKLSDRIGSIESPLQKSAIASQVFGDRLGRGLVNTINLGSEGMAGFSREAEILGLAVDRNLAGQIELANDSMGRLKAGYSGFTQQLAGSFAPGLTAIADKMFEVIEANGGMGKIAEQVFNFLIRGAAKVADAIDVIRVVWNIIEGALLKGITAITALLERRLREAAKIAGFFSDEIGDSLTGYADGLNKKLLEFNQASEEAWAQASESALSYGNNLESIELALDKVERKQADAAAVAIEGQQIAQEEVIETTDLVNRLGEANEKAAKKAKDEWTGAFDDVQKQLAGLLSQLAQGGEINLRGTASSIGGSVLDQFANQFVSGLFDSGLSNLGSGGISGGNAGTGGTSLSQYAATGYKLLTGGFAGVGAGASSLAGTAGQVGANVFGFGSAGSAIVDNVAGSYLAGANNFGSSLGFSGDAATGAGVIGNFVAGYVGSYAGTAIGEAVFDKEAESGIGATAGSIIGSYFGPWGTLIGSAIGGLADAAFGGDGKTRFNAGIIQGPNLQADGQRYGAPVTADSGLEIQTFVRRVKDEGIAAAGNLQDVVLELDRVLTATATQLGVDVDLSGTRLTGRNPDAGNGASTGAFFGSLGFNGVDNGLSSAAEEFVVAWLETVGKEFPEQIKKYEDIYLKPMEGTAQAIVQSLAALVQIDELINLDVVGRTEEALQELGKAQQTLGEQYQDLVTDVLDLAYAVDDSAESQLALADALTLQKNAAAELTLAYRAVGIETDRILGNTIQSIRESILSEEELYGVRRDQISNLFGELGSASSPDEIAALVAQIDSLANSAYGLLDPSQQQVMADEFIAFLTQANETAQERIEAGVSDIATNEDTISTTISAELGMIAAERQQRAADDFQAAVDSFQDIIDQFGLGYLGAFGLNAGQTFDANAPVVGLSDPTPTIVARGAAEVNR